MSTKKVILFYSQKKAFGFCSNFYHAAIQIEGRIWPTTEHYFQAMKFPSRTDL